MDAALHAFYRAGGSVELKEFLEAVTPSGRVVAARKVQVSKDGRTFNTFRHTIADSPEALERAVVNLAATPGNEVYYALASFKQGFHEIVDKGKTKKVIRVRENVEALKALWFDIDFKGGYANAGEVVKALQAFCTDAALPPPSILVGSGNGVHAYWPLAEAAPLDSWQRLADALKAAAKEKGLQADLACTADSCRVLRPPGTSNWKDPGNPKPVKILYSCSKRFQYAELEAALLPFFSTRTAPGSAAVSALASNGAGNVYSEFTGGVGKRGEAASAFFEEIIKHCGVAKLVSEEHGKTASEPEWVAMLQLLRHCEDGEQWVHTVSDGHAGYNADDTRAKWEARSTSHGPTLCSTLGQYHSSICAKCPHKGFIKTPLSLGQPGMQPLEGLPPGWRVAADNKGIERLMVDMSTDPPTKEWIRVMRYVITGLRVTRSIVTNKYEVQFDVEIHGSKSWTVSIPGGHLGNARKLTETLAEYGVTFKGQEGKSFLDLMVTWLGQLQAAKRIAEVTEQLGWMVADDKIVGFSCGAVTYYADGRIRNDVRTAREFTAIAKFYEPRGVLSKWKEVAAFLAEQNNPAFTALLASAFGAPLLRFTGQSGGILSVVSTASGVGKTSAMKCGQAVWGSPTHGINAVDDTSKSVARKLGFLNNLPAYWDELRGKKTVEDFLTLAFQVSQGKEKTRLDSSASLQEIRTWETLLVVASNESIFDAMARFAGGSDAGVARTFELYVEPFDTTRSRAEISLLFEALNHNYGHAGRLYAEYIASHHDEIAKRVETVLKNLTGYVKARASERFWLSIMTILIVGAEIASKIGLAAIDVKQLTAYLVQNLIRLRGRSVESMSGTEPSELLAAFMSLNQDKTLIVDNFPIGRQSARSYMPKIEHPPRADRVVVHVARADKLVRFPQNEFVRFLEYRGIAVHGVLKMLRAELQAQERRVKIGIGTSWELPPQRCIEVPLFGSAMKVDEVLEDDDGG